MNIAGAAALGLPFGTFGLSRREALKGRERAAGGRVEFAAGVVGGVSVRRGPQTMASDKVSGMCVSP